MAKSKDTKITVTILTRGELPVIKLGRGETATVQAMIKHYLEEVVFSRFKKEKGNYLDYMIVTDTKVKFPKGWNDHLEPAVVSSLVKLNK